MGTATNLQPAVLSLCWGPGYINHPEPRPWSVNFPSVDKLSLPVCQFVNWIVFAFSIMSLAFMCIRKIKTKTRTDTLPVSNNTLRYTQLWFGTPDSSGTRSYDLGFLQSEWSKRGSVGSHGSSVSMVTVKTWPMIDPEVLLVSGHHHDTKMPLKPLVSWSVKHARTPWSPTLHQFHYKLQGLLQQKVFLDSEGKWSQNASPAAASQCASPVRKYIGRGWIHKYLMPIDIMVLPPYITTHRPLTFDIGGSPG